MTPKAGARPQPPAPNTAKSPEDEPPPPVAGRRRSSPGFLLLLGVMWIVCGIVAFTGMSASWKLIPTIVFVGIGLLFIRGAAVAAARRDR